MPGLIIQPNSVQLRPVCQGGTDILGAVVTANRHGLAAPFNNLAQVTALPDPPPPQSA